MEQARIRRNTVGDVCRLVCRYSALVVSTPTSALVLLRLDPYAVVALYIRRNTVGDVALCVEMLPPIER